MTTTDDYTDRVAFYVAHRQMEAAGLGVLVLVGDSWEWVPSRAGASGRGTPLRAAGYLHTFALTRLREAVKAAARDGKSLRAIAAETGLSLKIVRGIVA